MKKGIVLLEIILSLAIFLAVALPILYLSVENQLAARHTQQRERSTDAVHNSLEVFYTGGYPQLFQALKCDGHAEDEYLLMDVTYRRAWEYLNFFDKASPMQIRMTLTWLERNGTTYETDLDFAYNPQKGFYTP